MQSFNIPGELQEQVVDIILIDNLDLGCAVIERAAIEKVCYHASMISHFPLPAFTCAKKVLYGTILLLLYVVKITLNYVYV